MTAEYPFRVECAPTDDPRVSAQLFRLSDGTLQVIVPGPLDAYLDGPAYLLAERSLARALAELCGADVQLRPARITRRSTVEVLTSHDELVVAREITAEEVRAGLLPPGRAWLIYGRHLMVASDVRQGLIERGFTQLAFTPGLEGFAG